MRLSRRTRRIALSRMPTQVRRSWNREQLMELLVGEGGDDGLGHPRHFEAGRDVIGNVAEPMAEPAEGLQLGVAVDCVGREAPATALQQELLEVGAT
jgi:hypothetical protein